MTSLNMNKGDSVDISVDIKLDKQFKLFVLWFTLPFYLRTPPVNKGGQRPSPAEYAESLGIDDPVIIEVIQCRTQRDFAIKYDVHENTLTRWADIIQEKGLAIHDDYRKWVLGLAKNVLFAMYSNAMNTRNLNADRDRLNFLKYAGWVEKLGLEHSVSENFFTGLKKALDKNGNDTTDRSVTSSVTPL